MNNDLFEKLRLVITTHNIPQVLPRVNSIAGGLLPPVRGHNNPNGLSVNQNANTTIVSCFNSPALRANGALHPQANNFSEIPFNTNQQTHRCYISKAFTAIIDSYKNQPVPFPENIRDIKVVVMQKLYGFSGRISYHSM